MISEELLGERSKAVRIPVAAGCTSHKYCSTSLKFAALDWHMIVRLTARDLIRFYQFPGGWLRFPSFLN